MKKYSSITRVNSRHILTKRKKVFFIVGVVLLVFGFLFPRLLSVVSAIVLYPVQSISSWYHYSSQTLPQYLRGRTALIEEIETLNQHIANETGTDLTIRRLQQENNELRAAVHFGTTTDRVVAGVLAEPTSLSYDLLQIDKGSRDGILLGAPVFVGVDTVIGVVSHVATSYAFVELITTPGFAATAFILGPNVFAPLEGVGGGIARVRLPQGIPLLEGNLVILPSTESGVYGEVVAVENLPTQPEQFGYVAPPIPLQSLLYVSVAKDIPSKKTVPEIETDTEDWIKEYFVVPTADLLELQASTTDPLASTTLTTEE